MITTITLSTEEGTVSITRQTGETWPELLEVFINVLHGAGYKISEFNYDGVSVSSIEDDGDVIYNFEVENDKNNQFHEVIKDNWEGDNI